MLWEMVALEKIASIERSVVQPEVIEHGTAYLGLEHIEAGGRILGKQYVEEGELSSAKFLFTARHLLFGKLRPYLAKIALPDFDGICSTDILPVLPSDSLDRRYLAFFLRQPSLVDYTNSRAIGANLPRLSPSELGRITIPLPPIEEQKRIAAILDAVDALRVKRRESIAQLDALLQSTFLDMFSEPDAMEWPKALIENVVLEGKGAIRTGPFGSQLLHSEFVEEGIRVLGIDNVVNNTFLEGEPRFITSEKYKSLRRYTVRPGDVLITIMGTCGRCAIVPEALGIAINTKHLCCISLNQEKVLPLFLHACFLWHPLARRYLERSAKGAIMSGLNMEIIKKVPIPLPPLSLQRRFASIVEAAERQKARLRAHLDELDALFSSLQSRAFNGEL